MTFTDKQEWIGNKVNYQQSDTILSRIVNLPGPMDSYGMFFNERELDHLDWSSGFKTQFYTCYWIQTINRSVSCRVGLRQKGRRVHCVRHTVPISALLEPRHLFEAIQNALFYKFVKISLHHLTLCATMSID